MLDEDEIFGCLSQQLQREVKQHASIQLIDSVPLFNGLMVRASIRSSIAQKLEALVCESHQERSPREQKNARPRIFEATAT